MSAVSLQDRSRQNPIFGALPSFWQLHFCSKSSSLEVPGCQNSVSKLRKAELSLKCRKTASGSTRPDWENCALRTVPASLQNFWQIQTGRHSAFLPFVGAFWGRPGVPPPVGFRRQTALPVFGLPALARRQGGITGKRNMAVKAKQVRKPVHAMQA